MTRMKQLRLKAGLSQKDLAKRAGVTQATISRLEGGQRGAQRPNLEQVEAIAKVLDCAPHELLKWEDNQSVGEKIIVRGIAEVGRWREKPFFPKGEQWSFRLPIDERFPGHTRQAVEIGPSQGYLEGTLAVYIEVADEPHLVENDKRYLVQRQNELGKFELSIRRLIEGDGEGKKWLVAENVAPSYLSPIAYNNSNPVVKLIGRIIGIVALE